MSVPGALVAAPDEESEFCIHLQRGRVGKTITEVPTRLGGLDHDIMGNVGPVASVKVFGRITITYISARTVSSHAVLRDRGKEYACMLVPPLGWCHLINLSMMASTWMSTEDVGDFALVMRRDPRCICQVASIAVSPPINQNKAQWLERVRPKKSEEPGS